MKSSNISDKPSKIWKFADIPRHVTITQPENKTIYFTHKIDKNPIQKNPVESFDSYIKRITIDSTIRDISDQDIPIQATLESIANRTERNYVEFRQKYRSILDQVKHEAEQARLLDSDIIEIKNEVYDDSALVMEEVYKQNVPIPEADRNEDGTVELTWFLKTRGTSTIVLLGDNHVVYNAYLGPDNYVRSVCKIRDGLLLPKLIGILSNITD